MRITCVIHSLAGGGAERVMAGLASRLAVRHHVTLVTLGDGTDDRHAVDARVQRVDLDCMADMPSGWIGLPARLVAIGTRMRLLRQSIRRTRPDVVLSFCDSMNVRVLLALRGGKHPPVVVAERSDPSKQSLGRIGDWLRRKTYRQAAAIVAQTSSQAETLRHWTNREVHVIASAVEPPISTISEQNGRVILGVGRLEHEKGFDRLLDAFAALHQEGAADWRLRIVGEGSQRDALQSQAESLGVAEAVQMPGWVSPIQPEYLAAGVFVLPSRYEGFPSALLEAMSVGLPSIAVDCESGPREIVDDGVNGLLVADSVDGLVAGMKSLTNDEVARQRFSGESVHVADRFGWDRLVDRFEDVLREASKSAS